MTAQKATDDDNVISWPAILGSTLAIFLCVAVLGLGYGYWAWTSGHLAEWGQLGDSLSPLAALLNTLAVVVALTSVFMQSRELALQRDELREARLAQQDMVAGQASANETAAQLLSAQVAANELARAANATAERLTAAQEAANEAARVNVDAQARLAAAQEWANYIADGPAASAHQHRRRRSLQRVGKRDARRSCPRPGHGEDTERSWARRSHDHPHAARSSAHRRSSAGVARRRPTPASPGRAEVTGRGDTTPSGVRQRRSLHDGSQRPRLVAMGTPVEMSRDARGCG